MNGILTAASSNIINIMKAISVRRLVVLSSPVVSIPEDRPTMRWKLITGMASFMVPRVGGDHRAQARVVASSGLDWTLVRAARLTNGPHTGHYRVGVLDASTGGAIAQSDVADFMLSCISDHSYFQMSPVVSK